MSKPSIINDIQPRTDGENSAPLTNNAELQKPRNAPCSPTWT